MSERLTIVTFTNERDDYGGETGGWSTHATVYGKIEYGSGTEKYAGDRLVAFKRAEITIYYRDDVTEKMFVLDASMNEFQILAAQPDDRKMYLILYCEQRE